MITKKTGPEILADILTDISNERKRENRKTTNDSPARSLRQIAQEIMNDWKKPYYGAGPYLRAMTQLDSMTDFYGLDPAKEIVIYFLSNAASWRGETARRVKKELNSMVR